MACTKECLILAAMGGLLPTAARLATTYTTAPGTPLPESGLYIGLAIFAVIGAVLAYALSESNARQALVLGIAAPGVITNILAGAQDIRVAQSSPASIVGFLLTSAHAQDATGVEASSSAPAANPSVALTLPALAAPRRSLVLSQTLLNGDRWSAARLNADIDFLTKEKTQVGTSVLVPAGQPARLLVPAGATTARVTVGNRTQEIPLNDSGMTGAHLSVTLSGKNDLLWALGANRKPIVSTVKIVGEPVQ
jgi:hypothetical protein